MMRGSSFALRAGTEVRTDPRAQKLLVVDANRSTLSDRRFDSLPSLVQEGDVWVLNDAATLPASLTGSVGDRAVELRLMGEREDGRWRAVLFGEGSWRDDTDHRPAPPRLTVGRTIALGDCLSARVVEVDPRSSRLLVVDPEPGGDAFWRSLYAIGRPIQYSYLPREMSLGELTTGYASRPWAVELPSAGRPLTAALLASLRRTGATVVTLTHAAGLSATGDPALDALLPLPERYDIPSETAEAVERAREEGRRVVAVGTSVTRALEGSAAQHGRVRAGAGETDLRIGPELRRRVVDALLTGAHDPSSSHYELLLAFAPAPLLRDAVQRAAQLGYLGHELGDSWIVLGTPRAA